MERSYLLAAAGIGAVVALWCAPSRHARRGSSTSCSDGTSSEVCVVKLGGSAITVKERFHTLNEAGLDAAVSQLQRIWQRRLDGRQRLDLVVVHGAGSFGHFEAKQYGISKGTAHSDHQLGFALTRQAVTSLNTAVVSRLLAKGLPAVGASSFPQWSSASAGVMDPVVAAEFAQQVRSEPSLSLSLSVSVYASVSVSVSVPPLSPLLSRCLADSLSF